MTERSNTATALAAESAFREAGIFNVRDLKSTAV
jgi:hypothetical protein